MYQTKRYKLLTGIDYWENLQAEQGPFHKIHEPAKNEG